MYTIDLEEPTGRDYVNIDIRNSEVEAIEAAGSLDVRIYLTAYMNDRATTLGVFKAYVVFF